LRASWAHRDVSAETSGARTGKCECREFSLGDARFMSGKLQPKVIRARLRLATEDGKRVELSLDNATLQLESDTDVTVMAIDGSLARFLVAAGTIEVHQVELQGTEASELEVGTLTAWLLTPGEYRVTLQPDGTVRMLVQALDARLSAAVAAVQQPARKRT